MIYRVSPHVLMDALSCESKAWVRHTLGYTTPGDALKAKAGQAVHASIATYLDPAAPGDVARALAAFHTCYDEAYRLVPAEQLDIAYTPDNIHRLLARWIEMHPLSQMPWKRVVEVETAFVSRQWRLRRGSGQLEECARTFEPEPASDLFDYIQLIVRPDILIERVDGVMSFVDTKSTGWRISDLSWRTALRLSLQFQLYTDAVIQRFGLEHSRVGGWVNAIELRQLPGRVDPLAAPKLKKDGTPQAPKKCAEHGVPYAICGHEHAKAELIEYTTTLERIARAVADAKIGALKMVKLSDPTIRVEDINTFGAANERCRFCPATSWCEDGSRIPAPKDWSRFVHDPWPVEVGTR